VQFWSRHIKFGIDLIKQRKALGGIENLEFEITLDLI
jgi:hypothetical protein